VDAEAPTAVDQDDLLSQINDPLKRQEVSKRVETELRKIFGDDPEAMKLAQQFIDNPMSALVPDNTSPPSRSTNVNTTAESRAHMTQEDDDEEAPPPGT
jgi:hypothetical protein